MANGPYDVFGPNWGLGLPISWFAADDIAALLSDALTQASTFDQLVEGWDGEPVDVMKLVRKVLRSRGYFLGYDQQGRGTIARARLADVTDIATATTVTPIPRTLRRVPAVGDGVDRVAGTYGKTPWFDGDRIEVNLLSDYDTLEAPNSLRAGIFADESVLELDLSCLAPRDLHQENYDLTAFVAMRGLALDTLYIRANDPGSIATGDILKVGDPGLRSAWFTDKDGNLIEVDSSARWYGQVVGFQRKPLDGSIDLELVMNLNEFARLRAPSAVVASVATNVYTCDSNNFLGPDGGGTDVEQFTVGDKCEVWTEDGVRRSGTAASPDVQEITAIGTNTLTMDAAWTTAPSAGDIIRLAHLDDVDGYPESGNTSKINGYLAYVYAADDTDDLGPNDIDAHIYSYGVL